VIYGNGGQTRDFTFVGDVVKANMLAMGGDVQGVFNVACGRRISLNELAERIMEIAGRRVEPVYDSPRSGDVRDSLADISRARVAMGYVPDYELESGLRETMRWFRRGEI